MEIPEFVLREGYKYGQNKRYFWYYDVLDEESIRCIDKKTNKYYFSNPEWQKGNVTPKNVQLIINQIFGQIKQELEQLIINQIFGQKELKQEQLKRQELEKMHFKLMHYNQRQFKHRRLNQPNKFK
jgi:hypothetical protein